MLQPQHKLATPPPKKTTTLEPSFFMYYYVLEDEKKHNHDHIWRCFRNSPPPEKLIVMAERAALFTWDDKSMNHLFQHCSAFAVCPRGTRFHLAHPPTLLVCPPAKKKKKRERGVFQAKSQASLCWCNDSTEPVFEAQTCVLVFVWMSVCFELRVCVHPV